MNTERIPTASGGDRVYFFDNLKLFLIFCVVLAHYTRVCGSFSPASPGGFFYVSAFSFIMQGFLFISGYFSKNVDKCRKTAAKAFLLPYVVLTVIMQYIRYFISGPDAVSLIVPAMGLWYLLALFVYRFFLKEISRIPGILPISILLALLAGGVPVLGAEFSLSRIVCFLPFFLMGYFCSKEHIRKIRELPLIPCLVLLGGLLIFSYICAFHGHVSFEFWHFREGYEYFDMDLVQGILGRSILMVAGFLWVILLVRLTPDKKLGNMGWITAMGAQTMTVYVLHIGIRYLIKDNGIYGDGSPVTYMILLLVAAGSVYLFSRPVVAECYDGCMDKVAHGLHICISSLRCFFSRVPAFLRRF